MKNHGESEEMEIGQLTENDVKYKNRRTKIMKDWYSKCEILPYGFQDVYKVPKKKGFKIYRS